MNFNKFINSDYLKENPLCSIGTYKDELNLATGACTRRVKKLVLTGGESWAEGSANYYSRLPSNGRPYSNALCTHAKNASSIDNNGNYLYLQKSIFVFETLTDFKSYLSAQYAAGTPVTVWYVLAEPTTETITVPTGLSGIEEGYLIQDGTPTPTNPIYPTANTVEQWFDLNHYIMGTSTDTITTLPAVIYPNATTATVGLKGQTVQSGTPTPDNPIMPQGTGERTANLFDKNDVLQDYRIGGDGKPFSDSLCAMSGYIEVTPNTIVNQNYGFGFNNCMAEYDENKTFIIRYTSGNGKITTSATTKYIRVAVVKTRLDEAMVTMGATATTFYEPYGYKIPISSAGTTTPIYLGEVQSTRRIKKLVLTGEETWYTSGAYTGAVYAYHSQFPGIEPLTPIYCTQLVDAYESQYTQGSCKNDSNSIGMWVFDTTTSPTTFKSYLAAQYAAGTPVTVWYVLATEETGIVNEPLMRIGDYADTVSNVSIPVTAGGDTLSVGTTVQPSEVTVNYKGWHPVADVHERNNGAWT